MARPKRATTSRIGTSMTATMAQNNFGQVLERAKREGHVFVTRYEHPEAVILSIAEYDALTGRKPVDLEGLEEEFDAMLLRMQQPSHRRAVDALFATGGAATPATRRTRGR